MEPLYSNQKQLYELITNLYRNLKKDGPDRKNLEYCKKRLEQLEKYWQEYQENDDQLKKIGTVGHSYFQNDEFTETKQLYMTTRNYIIQIIPDLEKTLLPQQPGTSTSGVGEPSDVSQNQTATTITMIKKQKINYMAFERTIKNINIEALSTKWEFEDALSTLNARWATIDKQHWEIQGETEGGASDIELEFDRHEQTYKSIKTAINSKMWSVSHREKSTPQMEIPTFHGNYQQWTAFKDLFNEAIHNNPSLSNAQKMQYLKGKLNGEAERLIQHLTISTENYNTAWEILHHRYDNQRLIFTAHVNTLLNLPIMQQKTLIQIKKLHDVTKECLNAIKNLGVDITTWDPIIVHILAQKLDNETYSEYLEAVKKPRDLPDLAEFLSFLETKFTVLETSRQKQEPIQKTQQNQPKKQVPNKYNNNSSWNNKSSYQSYNNPTKQYTKTTLCALCNADHGIFSCNEFRRMPDEQKLNTITQLKYCVNCLYDHHGKSCISTKRCMKCDAHHNTLLHDAFNRPSKSTKNQVSRPINQTPNSSHVSQDQELPEILLSTALVKVQGQNGVHVLRALIDQGSQISLISEKAAQMLGLPRQQFKGTIFGVGEKESNSKGMVNLKIGSMYSEYTLNANVVIINNLVKNLPNRSIMNHPWHHISNISLADPEFNISRPVDLLLGADVYSRIVLGGVLRGESDDQPIAQQSKLGWLLCGSVTATYQCNFIQHDYDNLHKFWEIEDVNTPENNHLSEEDQYCENFYQISTQRNADGTYVVALPMKPNFEEKLGSSKSKASAQFKQLESKLNKNPEFSESYKQFMREYINLNHMRPVSSAESNQQTAHYLPHHGVLKLDSETTKLRVVFNASSKTSSGNSLNDLMYSGPNLQQDLQALILKWRTYKYVLTADIEKFFRAVSVRESDQHLQRILWREAISDPLQEYQLTTVTYGMKAAPFLAMRTLKQLAKDEAQKFPLAAATIESSFYTDDLLTGTNSLQETHQLREDIINILKSANMNIRKWSSNEPKLLQDLSREQLNVKFEFKNAESRKTLGLQWNPTTDSFSYHNQNIDETNNLGITKRDLLSAISKVFDPLGWLSPLSIRAKLIFQGTWSRELRWDDTVPPEIYQEWKALKNDLADINEFKISRHLGNTQNECQLHAFCDASEKAYACVLYLVTNDKGEFTSKLIAAKTKVAPLSKKVSLPRLELCGALLLSQLVRKVLECFSGIDIKVHAWSDSMIVLGWLSGDISRWKMFVANRVQQIIDVIPPSSWRHVKSEENPADCATRGLSKQQLSEHKLWWQGPEWLLTFKQEENHSTIYQSPDIELKKAVCVNTALQHNDSLINDLLLRHSSLSRVTKVLGWVLRFITCIRDKQSSLGHKVLTSHELNTSRNIIIKQYQSENFGNDMDNIKKNGHVSSTSKISSLNPFIDEQGLLRVGGRLSHSAISDQSKHPIILSSHGRLTDLIIDQAHITTLHGGPRLTLAHIRNQFWIISGMRTVKRQLRRCVRCRRYSRENAQNIMGDLPRPRVTPSRPFTHTGVDFTGFIELRINKGRGVRTSKGYVAVFVCLSTKAVHLELVSDLSTPTFLSAFRRFCARRGTPRHMYSDNGTNFVGADRVLKREYREIIQNINTEFFDNINDLGIEWHFNAPAWPSAGGLWEAAVKSMKYHLKRVLGEQKLTYEEFSTLLHQIEACMNSRPLCQLSENTDDEYLTPGHFLVGGPLLSRPQTEPNAVGLTTRWHLVQAMNNNLWKRWSSEYLQNLQSRSKWRNQKKNLEINDVVIIKEDNLPPGKWALGRVIDLHPGQDGIVRVVTLKINNNHHIKRPVSKLIPLPVRDE